MESDVKYRYQMDRVFQGIWLVIAGFFIGRCRLMEVNPLAVGFFVAVCINQEKTVLTFLSLTAGLASVFPFADAVRYVIVLLGILALSKMKVVAELRGQELGLAFAGGVFFTAVSLAVLLFYPTRYLIWKILLEGAIVFSSAMLYLYGIRTVKNDYVKVTVENEAAISCMALAATVLYGMPEEIFGGLVIAETFALFSILFAIYKFGFGIGVSWTVIGASIMSAVTGNLQYMAIWLLVSVGAFALLCMLKGGRIAFAIVYGILYYFLGIFFYPFLITENAQKAVLTALFLFLLAPSRLMMRVDDRVRENELSESSREWGELIINRVNALASAFKRIEYTMAGDAEASIGFRDVGQMIENFTNQLEYTVPLRKTIEARIVEELSVRDMQVKNLSLVKTADEHYEIYLTLRVRKGRLVAADAVRKLVEECMGTELLLKEESRAVVGKNYTLLCMREKPAFSCKTAVRVMSRYEDEKSGDNFYVGDILEGQKLVMVADGMGSGEEASVDSAILIDSLEELLSAGFDRDMSIKIVNSYLAERNKGERFATLDMLLLDLYTGHGKIYKQGAAATFIKRGEWLEIIKSTSLPVGVLEGAVCEKCSKKFYENDLIVMVSDGVLESIIFENKEDYMRELLMSAQSDEPEEIASEIAEQIRAMDGKRLKDDATIIVCKLVKTL